MSNEKKPSRRKALLWFADTGRLRDAVAGKLDADAADLLIEVVLRYCEPRRKRRATGGDRG